MDTAQNAESYLNGLDLSSLLSVYFAMSTPRVSTTQLCEYASKKSVLVVPSKIKDYTLDSVIGAGAFGHCYLSEHGTTREQVVVKVGAKGPKYGVGHEGTILSYLQSRAVPNIIHLYETFSFGDADVMVMEHATMGDLTAFYEQEGLTREERSMYARVVIKDIASALSAMHELGIAHRDVRPGNIVLCQDQRKEFSATLIDFGTAVDIAKGHYPADCVPSPFSAPELEQSNQADLMCCDVYALGAIWYSLIEMELHDPEKQGIETGEGEKALDGMIRRMLKKDPMERPMMYQVREYLCAGNSWC